MKVVVCGQNIFQNSRKLGVTERRMQCVSDSHFLKNDNNVSVFASLRGKRCIAIMDQTRVVLAVPLLRPHDLLYCRQMSNILLFFESLFIRMQ